MDSLVIKQKSSTCTYSLNVSPPNVGFSSSSGTNKVVRGSIEHESLRKRTRGDPSKRFNNSVDESFDKAAEDEIKDRKRKRKPTWNEIEEIVTAFIIRVIVFCIPTRYNVPSEEMGGISPWEQRLRIQWLDRGLYKRKIVGGMLIFVFVVSVFFFASLIPWRVLLGTDSIYLHVNSRGDKIYNVIVPRMIDPTTDASDVSRADWILNGEPFPPMTRTQVKDGFVSVKTGYSMVEQNVSINLLQQKLNETAFGEYRCLCAIHLGIPLNAVMYTPNPQKIEQARRRAKTGTGRSIKGIMDGKHDNMFLLEPVPTAAKGPIVTSERMTSNLLPDRPFTVTHPGRMTVKFYTTEGLDDRIELRGDDVACAVRCIEVAWKTKLVNKATKEIRNGRPIVVKEQNGRKTKSNTFIKIG